MKNVTWQDVVKLGEMNPMIGNILKELSESPLRDFTQAHALLAMVDALDTRCAQLEQEVVNYREAIDQARNVRNYSNPDEVFKAVPLRLLENLGEAWIVARKAENGGGKVASEDAGS